MLDSIVGHVLSWVMRLLYNDKPTKEEISLQEAVNELNKKAVAQMLEPLPDSLHNTPLPINKMIEAASMIRCLLNRSHRLDACGERCRWLLSSDGAFYSWEWNDNHKLIIPKEVLHAELELVGVTNVNELLTWIIAAGTINPNLFDGFKTKGSDNNELFIARIPKCWTCKKEFPNFLTNSDDYICVRWAPKFIGTYCNNNKCSGEDNDE